MGRELHERLCCLAAALLLGGCVPHPVYRADEPAPPLQPDPVPAPTPPQGSRPSDAPRPRPAHHRWPLLPSRSQPSAAQPEASPQDPRKIDTSKAYQMGLASFIGREMEGHRTASGERYRVEALTAAHRLLPLGTRVRVTNLGNGKGVEVTVNDRGPFHRGRVIDISYAAAQQLGMVGSGTARVMLEVIDAVE